MGIRNSLLFLCLFLFTSAQAGDVLLTTIRGEAFGGIPINDSRGRQVGTNYERIEFFAITNPKNEIQSFRMDTYYLKKVGTVWKMQTLKQSIGLNYIANERGFQVSANDVVIPSFKQAKGFMKDPTEELFSIASRKLGGNGGSVASKISPTTGGALRLKVVKSVSIVPALGIKVAPDAYTYAWFTISKDKYGVWEFWMFDSKTSKYVSGSRLYMMSTRQDFLGVGTQMTGVSKILNYFR